MTIYIIGAGAIGKALAVCLTQHRKDIQLILGCVDDTSSYSDMLSLKLKSGQELTADVKLNFSSNFSEVGDLVELTNKFFGIKELAEKLKSKVINAPIVILQNGIALKLKKSMII